jgi:putative sterol carrier protein
MEAARLAVAGDASLRGATAGVRLTVDGPAVDPDLRFTTDYATAAQIAAGELGAQRAFVEGRLRVGGDLGVLIRHQKALSTIDDALAGVRSRTQRT